MSGRPERAKGRWELASFCKVIILGNCTRDPEVKYLPSGTAVCELGVAVNHRYKKDDEWIDEPTFVDVTMFGRTAEVAGEYLVKGSQVLIEGRLKLETWDDKNGGGKRSKMKVICETMQMVGKKSGGSGDSGGEDRQERSGGKSGGSRERQGSGSSGAKSGSRPPADDSEIPF